MSNDPGIPQALAALDSADLAQRLAALHWLRGHMDPRITPKLTPLLRDPSADVRLLAAEILASNGEGAVQALIDALYDDNAPVRAAAADALGEIGDRAAVPALTQVLYDEDTDVRFAAAEALGRLGDQRAVVDLIHMLDNDDAPLSAMAAMALHKIGTPEALAAIQHLFDGERFVFDDEDTVDADETLRHVSSDLIQDFFGEASEPEETLRPTSPPPAAAEAEAAPPAISAPNPVQFSAYYPREIMPSEWQPLRAYVFAPSAASAVAADAAQELGALLPSYREVERASSVSIAEGALITATPTLAGFQFNPPSAQVGFYEDWQHFDFKLRSVSAPLDQSSNGQITFTVEGVIVADIPLSVYVGASTAPATPTGVTRPIYQSIFCSYSRKDTQVVEHVERAYKALGMNFLRDVVSLKSGQDWSEELLNLIQQADIFQLFWSSSAAASEAVRKEWMYALSLRRQDQGFIRPVFWEQPMPPPPPELSPINFAYEPDLDEP